MNNYRKKCDVRDIFAELKRQYDSFSKSHKKIALYIMRNFEKVPDMSAMQVARAVHVSEATVVRFAIFLGYEGYLEFRKFLKDEMNSKLTTVERIDLTMGDDGKALLMKDRAKHMLKSDIESVKDTLANFDEETFEHCVGLIAEARKVIIIGFRTTSLLTEYFGYYLGLVLDDVHIVNHGVTDFYEHLIKIGENDVVIAISFPRYAKKTMEAVEFFKDRGPKIIMISDNDHAPINQYADYTLLAKSNAYAFVDSLVAPLSIIDALVVAIGLKNVAKTKRTFKDLEEIWKENYVYTGDELERDLWNE
ncbi:MurR/RpiR family transcriptional regulator [Eubacterium aggregans]|uniref:MurR/RpiR family transcriptional regulator n=1 Tax=Eubacterium aggregans TaxID=81409 RepID=UPI003F3BCDEB